VASWIDVGRFSGSGTCVGQNGVMFDKLVSVSHREAESY
jgi:hypothetical protein